MISSQALQTALSWVLTYAVHSTLFLASAWLITRWMARERWRARERVWKTALVAGLFSACLQVGFDVEPLGGRFELATIETPAAQVEELASMPAQVLAGQTGTELLDFDFTWQRLVLGLWALGGALGIAIFLLAWRRIVDRLAGRRVVRHSAVRGLLEELASAAGLARAPRLTASHHLRSPATVGVFFPQICLPYRAIAELSRDEQRALLAHELAHIVRRDPLWFFVCGVLERVFFFQPLNRLAHSELQEIAEFQSDDWAVQRTGDELCLARCLTEVATWVLDARPRVAVVPMASRNSRLASRIGRLLDEERVPQDHERPTRALAGPASILLTGVLLLPGAAPLAESANAESHVDAAPTLNTESPLAVLPASCASPDSPAPNRGLDAELAELLELLDEELSALSSDVEELYLEVPVSRLDPERAATFSDLDSRVRSLRDRRAQLADFLPALLTETE